jgi:archaemetzincin
MKAIELIAVGAARPGPLTGGEQDPAVSFGLLDELAAVLARIFRLPCRRRSDWLDAAFAFDPARNQYHSTAILQRLERLVPDQGLRLLGLTALDLYVPVLTFVFGEAQLSGRCALASFHRLREEFYGLPASNDRLHERLHKEAVHELGHTFGLRHCDDWQCVMASTHSVERLDLKSPRFCSACRRTVLGVQAVS